MMTIKIYQINLERDEERVAFMSHDATVAQTQSGEIDSESYDKIYEGEVDADNLEDIYRIFNIAKPTEFAGRSLSVSDVVEVVDSDSVKPGFYFCDSIGYKEISFEPEATTDCSVKQTITVVMVEPGKMARVAKIGSRLEDMQKAVGGYIEAYYPYEEEVCIVCNEEGKLNNMLPNRAIYGEDNEIADIVFGPFFVCDCSGENFGSLSQEQLDRYTKQFKYPERLFRERGKLMSLPYEPRTNTTKERGE